ncbi:MAG TPA: DUF2341 domain-containing protein [Kofleriaceae bacterium]|nr:DUF2341 domain-containing protein [Kofleriaceae bacterium]
MRASPTLLTVLSLVVGSPGCGFDPAGTGGGGGDGGRGEDGGDDPDGSIDPDGPPGIDATPPDARGPGRRKSITIDPARVDGTQSDFPVWVAIVDPAIGARAANDGSDIYFTSVNGTALSHEMQRYVDAEGRVEAWVKLPSVDDTQPTRFYLNYGDASVLPVPAPDAVWSNGFNAVWHLDATSPASEPDSAGDHDATASGGLNGGNVVAGQIGRGLNFEGANHQLAFTNTLTGNGAHTMSAWVNQRTTGSNDALIVIGNPACNQSRWFHTRYNTSTVATGFYCSDWDNPGVDIQGDGWVLVHWVYDGAGAGRMYLNGSMAAGPHTYVTPPATAGANGFIGNAPAGFGATMGLVATVDEVRIATVARTAGWIATERNNQNAPASFYVVGAEE